MVAVAKPGEPFERFGVEPFTVAKRLDLVPGDFPFRGIKPGPVANAIVGHGLGLRHDRIVGFGLTFDHLAHQRPPGLAHFDIYRLPVDILARPQHIGQIRVAIGPAHELRQGSRTDFGILVIHQLADGLRLPVFDNRATHPVRYLLPAGDGHTVFFGF